MRLGPTTTLPEAQCPSCGKIVDRATVVGSRGRPKPGDATVCIGCGEVALFGDDLQLRRPTTKEVAELKADFRIAAIQEALRVLNEERGR